MIPSIIGLKCIEMHALYFYHSKTFLLFSVDIFQKSFQNLKIFIPVILIKKILIKMCVKSRNLGPSIMGLKTLSAFEYVFLIFIFSFFIFCRYFPNWLSNFENFSLEILIKKILMKRNVCTILTLTHYYTLYL